MLTNEEDTKALWLTRRLTFGRQLQNDRSRLMDPQSDYVSEKYEPEPKRLLEKFIIWYDKPVTHGDLLIQGIILGMLQIILWFPFLKLVWLKM